MNIEIDNVKYSTRSAMDTFTQLKVARRLGPAVPLIEGLVAKENLEKDRTLVLLLMFSHIKEEDMMYVIQHCLELVDRQEGDGQPVAVQRNGTLMFDTIPMDTLLKVAVHVVEENIGDFFRTALSTLEAERKKLENSSE